MEMISNYVVVLGGRVRRRVVEHSFSKQPQCDIKSGSEFLRFSYESETTTTNLVYPVFGTTIYDCVCRWTGLQTVGKWTRC